MKCHVFALFVMLSLLYGYEARVVRNRKLKAPREVRPLMEVKNDKVKAAEIAKAAEEAKVRAPVAEVARPNFRDAFEKKLSDTPKQALRYAEDHYIVYGCEISDNPNILLECSIPKYLLIDLAKQIVAGTISSEKPTDSIGGEILPGVPDYCDDWDEGYEYEGYKGYEYDDIYYGDYIDY